MDPLSITAGIIAVSTLIAQVTDILVRLREELESLPGHIHGLNNEVQDIKVVLQQVAIAVEERRISGWKSHGESTLPILLTKGENILRELKIILERNIASGTKKRDAVSRLLMWRKDYARVAILQGEIKGVKSSLNILLGASNSRDMMFVRLHLEELNIKLSQSKEPEMPIDETTSSVIQTLLEQHQESISKSLRSKYTEVDERLGRVEAMLQAQASYVQASQISQVGPLYSQSAPLARRRPVRAVSPVSAARIDANSSSVRVHLRQVRSACQGTCSCSCHSAQKKKTPSFMDRMLGQLFVGYSGLPLISAKCDTPSCVKAQVPSVTAEYWFPLGFCWSQIIRLQMMYEINVGPSLQLSTLRRVADSSPCVTFALDGNIDGLKGLFRQGLASPRDVSSTRGYSLLRWALYGQQYETCKFLMAAGADPTYRPIAQSDDCPSDKAGDIILRGRIPQEVVEILRLISELDDYVERQGFARIHKIVLNLCGGDLEEEIRCDPRKVDSQDATGRSALQWAAARGDDRAVITLLSWGADPNNMDIKLNTPLTLAANQNQTTCVRLLLEAGALTDPELPPGIKFGTPLNCAARNAPDPILMKTLLDFGAEIEASGVDGVTPLLHVARGSSAAHAVLLLEYGANINATSKSGQTPLTAAIQYNNHGALSLLLERWSEYVECPRLKGPGLLEVVAQYADVRTIRLLTKADHLQTRTDSSFILNRYQQMLDARNDASEKLSSAFEDLLSILQIDAKPGDANIRRESGLLNPLDFLSGSEENTDTDSDCLVFEDAKEDVDSPGDASDLV